MHLLTTSQSADYKENVGMYREMRNSECETHGANCVNLSKSLSYISTIS